MERRGIVGRLVLTRAVRPGHCQPRPLIRCEPGGLQRLLGRDPGEHRCWAAHKRIRFTLVERVVVLGQFRPATHDWFPAVVQRLVEATQRLRDCLLLVLAALLCDPRKRHHSLYANASGCASRRHGTRCA